MAAQKIAQRDYEQAEAEVEKWERRIQLALQAGREDLACEALFRRNVHQDRADKLKALIDLHILKVDTLKRNLTSWEGKVSTAKNELLLTERNTSSAISSFERIEEKILQMDATAYWQVSPHDKSCFLRSQQENSTRFTILGRVGF